MKHITSLLNATNISRLLAVVCGLAVSSCSSYSTASKKRLACQSPTRAGQFISEKLNHLSKDPLVQIGGNLDAVERTKELLKKNPNNQQARTDYNFAVSRIMEAVNEEGLKPRKISDVVSWCQWHMAIADPGESASRTGSGRLSNHPLRPV